MKLRNKHTGKIINIDIVKYRDEDGWLWTDYETLKSLSDEWEDYTPAEPLIKDEKIRKAVRAWAEANVISKARIVKHDESWFEVRGNDNHDCSWAIEIHGGYSESISNNYDHKLATITELCGEEKEK